ncbi:galactose-specific lectin nattectin-like protein [Lates japonicus]|uniref:Galactose-specific lectin nattectin-like protein n=1 Tax=Lates japonicus TaxID=270547 RepID=A0AAD3M3J2_LATJO|nr:galactose-specific lectin nattectin-like protein [Lates japonicus]
MVKVESIIINLGGNDFINDRSCGGSQSFVCVKDPNDCTIEIGRDGFPNIDIIDANVGVGIGLMGGGRQGRWRGAVPLPVRLDQLPTLAVSSYRIWAIRYAAGHGIVNGEINENQKQRDG